MLNLIFDFTEINNTIRFHNIYIYTISIIIILIDLLYYMNFELFWVMMHKFIIYYNLIYI